MDLPISRRAVGVTTLFLLTWIVSPDDSTTVGPPVDASGTQCVDATWTYDGAADPPTCSRTFSYLDGTSTESFVVPSGVEELTVELFGGKASNGDAEQGDTGWVGHVAGDLNVVAADVVTVAVGGDAAQSSGYVFANAAGLNPLPGYDGGYRGNPGTQGSSRAGQSGGAASVIVLDRASSTMATIVAGGAGGGGGGSGTGGAGGVGQTGFRSTSPVGRVSAPAPDVMTNGQPGQGPGYVDGAGGGGGGGGATGGRSYQCVVWDCNGLGGSAGLNDASDLVAGSVTSTYVNPATAPYTSSQIVISYEVPFTASISPSASVVAGSGVSFDLEFNFPIDPSTLTVDDVVLASGSGSAAGCSVTSVSGSGTSYSITVSGCTADGAVTPTLAASSVVVSNEASVPVALRGATGPASPISGASATIDNTAPSPPLLSMAAGSGGPALGTGGVTVESGIEFSTGPSSTDASGLTYTCSLDGGTAQSPCPASFTGLSPGDHSLLVTATDAAGNTSSTTFTWTQAGAPLPSLAPASDTGVSDTDRVTSDSSPTIEPSGLVEGATVTVRGQAAGHSDVTCSFTVTATVRSCDLALTADGTWSIDAKVTDPQGQDTAWSTPAAPIVLDTTAPAAPTGVDLAVASDTGASSTDDITGDATPRIEVAGGSIGDRVTVSATPTGGGAAVMCSFTVGLDAGCDLPQLDDGEWSVSSTFTDPAGNESAPSPVLTVAVDASPPAGSAPTLDPGSDTGPNSVDGVTSDLTPEATLDGLTAGDVVTMSATPLGGGSTVTCTFTAIASRGGCELVSLSEGTWSLTAQITDRAGNSTQSEAAELSVDTTAPATPGAPDLAASSDLGASDRDDLTADTTPRIHGGGTVGDTVDIVATPAGGGSPLTCSYVVTDDVTSCDLPAMSDGAWDISATVTDPAGNRSGAGPSLGIVIDGTPGAVLGRPSFAPDADPAVLTADGYSASDTFRVVVPGTAVGDIVLLTAGTPDGGVATCSFTASVAVVGCEIGPLDDGDWTIVATREDAAGNSSPPSPGFVVGVRGGAPVVSGIDTAVDGDSVEVSPVGPMRGDIVDVTGSNGGVTVPCTFTMDVMTTGCTLMGLTPGIWSVSASVTDPFGRESVADEIRVVVPAVGSSVVDGCLSLLSALVDGRCEAWDAVIESGSVVLSPAAGGGVGGGHRVTIASDDPSARMTDEGILATPGSVITLTGSGFIPGDRVAIRAGVDGVEIVAVVAGPDGTWSVAVTVPTDGTVIGSILIAEWTDSIAAVRVRLGLGSVAGVSELPTTGGGDGAGVLILLLALGGLIRLMSRGRALSA